jgi:vitamin B12 transporter
MSQEIASDLDLTVVTADRVPEAKRLVTSNISVISREDLDLSAAKDLGDLMAEKGFHVRKYPGVETSVGLRGFRSDTHGNDLGSRVLILVNGQRTATGNLAKIMLDAVDRIEMIRGPASVQYGAAAMGGVINVITQKGQEGITAKAELGVGSYGAFKSLAGFSGRHSGLDYFASYSHSSSNDFKDGKGRKYTNSAVGKNNSINASLGYTFNGLHRIGAEFAFTDIEDIGSPGGMSFKSETQTMDKSLQTTRLSYSGETEAGDWAWSANYTYAEDKRKYYGYEDWMTGASYSSFYYVDADLIQTQVNYNHKYFKLTAGWDFAGYELEEIENDLNPNNKMQAKYDNSAFFFLGKLLLLDESLIVSAGGRYDDYKIKIKGVDNNNSETNFSPSVGVAYLPLPWLKFRAHYAEGFRMPSTLELLGMPAWAYYGDINLKPEKSKTWEFGFDVAGDYADLNFTYYQSKHDNFITTIAQGWDNYYVNWENTVERDGVEIEASFDIAGYLGANYEVRPYANVNFMTRYKDAVTGYKIPFVPARTVGYGVRFVHPGFNLSAQLNFHYIGPEFRDARETQRNGGYTVTDFVVKKRILDFGDKGHLDARAEVLNLFDKYYENVREYPSPGRNFFVAVSYNY